MLKVFVCVPHGYFMTEEEADAHRRHLEELALRTAIYLNKYVKLIEDVDTLTENDRSIAFYKVQHLRNCMGLLWEADYVVFADEWQFSEECRIIHAIAEFCSIEILKL
ncbi:MAG: hypothetical protein IJM68_00805 [Synergistaceae bacterium]|nr:hypothetical protein [Synergistaceae bacterium]